MKFTLIRILAAMISLMCLHPLTAAPQPAPAAASAPRLTAGQLDRLVAPIALFPDPLIAQILMAATYPLEVVEADRWLQVPANAVLKGDQLRAALERQRWDPSVKSLVAFPPLLRMMDNNLDWIEELGDAFLAQQGDVMDAIQRLRRRAEAIRSLASTPQQTVSREGQEIVIEPTNPAIVYVPAYNPWCVYGPWPYPDYPPFYFETWTGYCVPILTFDGGIYPPFGFWAWGFFGWRRHHILINHARFERFHPRYQPPGGVWQHNPAHRHGVPYRDRETAARFLGPGAAARRDFRGFVPAPAAVRHAGAAPPPAGHPPAVIRGYVRPSLPRHPLPPAYESFGRGAQVRSEAARGFSSRMAPAPSFHAAPAPGFHAAPAFHGGGIGGHR